MASAIDWLLQGEPWVQYRARIDLLGESATSSRVAQARKAMLAHPQVQSLVNDLSRLHDTVISSHKSAGHPLHKLVFAADLGLRTRDSGIRPVVDDILKHRAPDGPFQVLMNIPVHFGGSGKDQWAWALCDTPLLLYACCMFGLSDDKRVQKSAEYLAGLVRENGRGCTVAAELGKFRGPGRKSDPCPYANLAMLQALAQLPEWRDSAACHTGVDTLLSLWRDRRTSHPYMFFMGTDFSKLKAPLVWYDILHVLDVLTQFPSFRSDRRLRQMVEQVRVKMDEQGRFTPESIWQAWQNWEFGQKREPSRWLTFLAHRILTRMGATSPSP